MFFCFVLFSLIRTFDLRSKVGCTSEKQNKFVISFGFSLGLHYLCSINLMIR